MRVCDLNTGLGQLSHAATELRERWLAVNALWNDETAKAFEETHLRPIPVHLQQLFTAAQVLAEVVEQAEQELGDHAEHQY